MDWRDLTGKSRLDQMKDAIRILIQWQQSVYYMPLLENPSAYAEEKDRIAAVLVDNHLGKLAKKIRMLPDKPGENPDVFLNQWSEIVFMSHLWMQFDSLSDSLKLNLLYQSGPNITKKHLEQIPPYSGEFHVVSVILTAEENLQRRTVYLLDRLANQIFMLVDYSFRNQPFERMYEVGETYKGEVILYPVHRNHRIRIENWMKVSGSDQDSKIVVKTDLFHLADSFSVLLRENPFASPIPTIVLLHSTFKKETGWKAMDQNGNILRINDENGEERLFAFYSTVFYAPVPVMGLWDQSGFLPQSYYNGEEFVPF